MQISANNLLTQREKFNRLVVHFYGLHCLITNKKKVSVTHLILNPPK